MSERGPQPPKYDGEDFMVWRIQMEAYLIGKEIFGVVQELKPQNILRATATVEEKKERDTERQLFEKVDKVVKSILLLSLDAKTVRLIASCNTSKEIWDRLCALHEQKSNASKITLQKEFFDLQMKYEEKVSEYVARAESLYYRLIDVGVSGISEQTLTSRIVCGLPKRFVNFMSRWADVPEKQQTVDNLLSKLSAEESLLLQFFKPRVRDEKAYVGESSTQNERRDDNRSKTSKTCWKCGKDGHIRRFCRSKDDRKEDTSNQAHQAEDIKEAINMVAEESNVATCSLGWVLDSGATSHMSYDIEDFTKYEELSQPRMVKFGGGSCAPAVGIGSVSLDVLVGTKVNNVILNEVLHVPSLRRKLVSVSAATSKGCTGEITANEMVLVSDGIVRLVHQMSAPFTPQQNGFIERDNRTIVKCMRTMLLARSLPEYLWGEAANAAVYVLNRTPNRNTGSKTPFELYFKRKPRVGHLRIFGSLVHVKRQQKKRSGYQKKLEPRTDPMVLVGYDSSDVNQNYRIFDPISQKLIITREVTIDETRRYNFAEKRTADDDDSDSHLYIHIDELLTEPTVSAPNSPDTEMEQRDLDISDYLDTINDQQASAEEPEDVQQAHSEHRVDDGSEATEIPDPRPSVNIPSLSTGTFNLPVSPSQLPRQASEDDQRRYPTRSRKATSFFIPHAQLAEALVVYGDEPITYHEAVTCPDARMWKRAMDEEFKSLEGQKTWILTRLPHNRKTIKCKWVYKVKYDTSGRIERYKARLVAKGFSQRAGIDYTETFSPVVRLDSIRILLAYVAKLNLEMIHFDVKTAFLDGNLEEEIYMEQPEGYKIGNNNVCLLKKSLYGLKQASRQWNLCFTQFLQRFNLRPLIKDGCIFRRFAKNDREILIIAIYVDDGLICCSNLGMMSNVIDHLRSKFEIKLMDPRCFVGLEIHRNRRARTLFINQELYATKILERFSMLSAKSASTPFDCNQRLCIAGANDGKYHPDVNVPYRQAIGSLMYLMIGSRPDIAYAIGILSRYSEHPKLAHWYAVKRVFQYIRATTGYGIKYNDSQSQVGAISCWSDSDYAADTDTRKSLSGYVIIYNVGPVLWKSTKQSLVATSTCEAEFVAASLATKDSIWSQQLLSEFGVMRRPIKLYVDNQGALQVIANKSIHSKCKHIDTRYMHIRELSEQKRIVPTYVQTKQQLADIFTKPLAKSQLEYLRDKLNIVHSL